MLDYVTDGRDEYRAVIRRCFTGQWLAAIKVREVGDTGDWYTITNRRFKSEDLANAWAAWFLEHQAL